MKKGKPEIQPIPPDSPYNPLDLRNLAESMARIVIDQIVHPLSALKKFRGAGIYILYYTGDLKAYRVIRDKNIGERWEQPIYIGEATRKGGRKGGVLASSPAGEALFSRLTDHRQSLEVATNLKVDDFWCRYLVLEDFFIPLCESLLIERYAPVWNMLVDGFGNKVLGANRQKSQQISMWDLLHPGRAGAGFGINVKYATADEVERRLESFLFGSKPVPIISVAKAVAIAEEAGRVDPGNNPNAKGITAPKKSPHRKRK